MELGVEGWVEVRDVAAGEAIEEVSVWSWLLSSWSLAVKELGQYQRRMASMRNTV